LRKPNIECDLLLFLVFLHANKHIIPNGITKGSYVLHGAGGVAVGVEFAGPVEAFAVADEDAGGGVLDVVIADGTAAGGDVKAGFGFAFAHAVHQADGGFYIADGVVGDGMAGAVYADAAVAAFNGIAVDEAIVPAAHYQFAITIFKIIVDIAVIAALIADHFGLAVAADKTVIAHQRIGGYGTQ